LERFCWRDRRNSRAAGGLLAVMRRALLSSAWTSPGLPF
jgi:hypothetical protein